MSTLTSSYGELVHTVPVRTPKVRELAARVRAWFARPSKDPVEQLIDANGGVLTDSLEREIARRLGA